jgi:integrase/recombinase XerC
MKEYIDEFIEFLEIEKHYSKETTTNYKIDLHLFLDYCNKNKFQNFGIIQYDDLRKYLFFLSNDKKYSNKSISRHISSLHSLYNFLIDERVIDNNIMNLVNSPKKEIRLPIYLTSNEIEKVISIPNTDTIEGKRDILILEMFYSTGIRLSELVNIKLKDIDFNNKKIKILGKGMKERYVLYGDKCQKYLKEYLNILSKLRNNDNNYLFLNKNGQKISKSGIEYIIKKILNQSGISVKLTPHVLRHTFATHMLNEGADLMTVKELLGHSDLATTGIYTHVSNEHLRRTYLNAHPRARKGK